MAEKKKLVPLDQIAFSPQPFPQTESDNFEDIELEDFNKNSAVLSPSFTELSNQSRNLHTAIRPVDSLMEDIQSAKLSTQSNAKSIETSRFFKRPKIIKKKVFFVEEVPGKFYLCCDSKSTVLVSNTILALFSLIYTIFNIITYDLINVMGYFLTFMLTFFINLNVILFKLAALYIAIATTLAITVFGHSVYNSIKLYENVNEYDFNTLRNILAFEIPVISVLLTFGLIQLYRTQSYLNAIAYAKSNSKI